jgi:hypothetical protein
MPKSSGPEMKSTTKAFEGTLERKRDRLNWTVVAIPFDAGKVWGRRGQIKIKGEINGFPFRTSLFPDGKGSHFLMVNKAMQTGGRATAGMRARFRLEPDRDERAVDVPLELENELRGDKELQRYFKSLSHSTRNDVSRWIDEAKQEETRMRRAGQIAERLFQTMEAERGDLPPVLLAAFKRFPNAAWDGKRCRLRTSARSGTLPRAPSGEGTIPQHGLPVSFMILLSAFHLILSQSVGPESSR